MDERDTARTNVKFISRWSWVRMFLIIEWDYRERLKESICRELFWEIIESFLRDYREFLKDYREYFEKVKRDQEWKNSKDILILSKI